MNSYEPQKHQKSPKKRKSPHISTFSPPNNSSQPNRHPYHLQNTLPRPQKVQRLNRTQNNENRTKNRVFSVSPVSPSPDNETSPNVRRNRLQINPLYLQKVPQVERKQRDEKRPQTLPFSPFSHFSVSPPPDHQNPRNLRWNRRRNNPTHSQKVPQVKRTQNSRKNPPKHRQLTPYTSMMNTTTLAHLYEIRNLALECKEDVRKMSKILGEIKTDLKAKGTTASSSSNIISPVPHSGTPSTTPSPIVHQTSHTSISTQTTTSVSIQTDPITEIFENATPFFVNTSPPPVVQSSPYPTLSLGPIPLSIPSLLPTLPPSVFLRPSQSPHHRNQQQSSDCKPAPVGWIPYDLGLIHHLGYDLSLNLLLDMVLQVKCVEDVAP